jgi:hypothetical protein
VDATPATAQTLSLEEHTRGLEEQITVVDDENPKRRSISFASAAWWSHCSWRGSEEFG